MTYRGQVKNGVVVLEGNPTLDEGTVVDVQPVEASRTSCRGSAQAIMEALRAKGSWQGDPREVDRFLADRKAEKHQEVQAEMEGWRREDEAAGG